MNLRLILTLIIKEAEQVIKDHSILLVLFIAPILYFVMMGSTYIKKDEEKVSVGVVDMDLTKSSKSFLNKVNATQKVDITHVYNSLPEAKIGMSKFEIQGIISIPRDFGKKTQKERKLPYWTNSEQYEIPVLKRH